MFLWMAIVFVVLAGGVWLLTSRQRQAKVPSVETVKVVRRNLNSTVLATGSVKPQIGAEVRVGARISGKVERLHANIGDKVTKGQVVAELEKADLLAVVNQRRAELDLAEKELVRQEDLLKQDFTSKQTRDQAHARKEVA